MMMSRRHLPCQLLACLVLLVVSQTTYSLSFENAPNRRTFLKSIAVGTAFATQPLIAQAAADPKADFEKYLTQIEQSRKQLDAIPKLIEDQKWDSIRAILIQSPLADCWAKTSRPLLNKYAESLGDVGGDEFAALEAREDLVGHLRFLDMAAYNNVFNPIGVEGKSGATKTLISSYYDDPINEFKASKIGFDQLLSLAKEVQGR